MMPGGTTEVIEDALIGQVRARVDADEQLDVEAGLLVLAALEGDQALDGALLEEAADRQAPAAAAIAPTHTLARRAFLDTISVQGFRGIGPSPRMHSGTRRPPPWNVWRRPGARWSPCCAGGFRRHAKRRVRPGRFPTW